MSLRSLAKLAVTLVVAVGAVVVAPSPASAANVGPVMLFPARPDPVKCVGVPKGNTANNVLPILWPCNRLNYDQQWTFEDLGGGVWQIRNRATSKCLTVQNASKARNAAILQFDCNGGLNSRWRTNYIRPLGSGLDWYELQNVNSGLCMAVKNASTADGATFLQFDCNRGLNAQFTWNYPFP